VTQLKWLTTARKRTTGRPHFLPALADSLSIARGRFLALMQGGAQNYAHRLHTGKNGHGGTRIQISGCLVPRCNFGSAWTLHSQEFSYCALSSSGPPSTPRAALSMSSMMKWKSQSRCHELRTCLRAVVSQDFEVRGQTRNLRCERPSKSQGPKSITPFVCACAAKNPPIVHFRPPVHRVHRERHRV